MMRYLQDIMRNISMWVTIYNPFVSNLGIDENWNQLDYPWVFILPLSFFLYVESLLCKPKFSMLSYANCIYIRTSAGLDWWISRSAHDIA